MITIILTGIGDRRAGRRGRPEHLLARIGAVLTSIVLAAYVVAVWAMSAKPGLQRKPAKPQAAALLFPPTLTARGDFLADGE